MNVIEKIKTFNIKINPPRRSRRELIEKTNVGFEPAYRIGKVEGIDRSIKDQAAGNRKYAKNWSKMHGLCEGCEHHDAKNKTVGGHCKLKETEHCVR